MLHGTPDMVCRLLDRYQESIENENLRFSSPMATFLLKTKLEQVLQEAPEVLDHDLKQMLKPDVRRSLSEDDGSMPETSPEAVARARAEYLYLVDAYARCGAATIVEINKEMAVIDGCLIKKEAFMTKVVAGACSIGILAGQAVLQYYVAESE